MRKLLDWTKNNYLPKAIFEPFRALGRHKVESFIWFMFVIALASLVYFNQQEKNGKRRNNT